MNLTSQGVQGHKSSYRMSGIKKKSNMRKDSNPTPSTI